MSFFNRKPPENAGKLEQLELQLSELRTTVIEVQDKVYHWMKRHEARQRAAADPEGQHKPDAVTAGPQNIRVQRLLERRANGTVAHPPAG